MVSWYSNTKINRAEQHRPCEVVAALFEHSVSDFLWRMCTLVEWTGHVAWRPVLERLSWCPPTLLSHYNSFWERTPMDEICRCLIFKMMTLVPEAGISGRNDNFIPHNTVGCNYLSLPEIPASGTKVLKCAVVTGLNYSDRQSEMCYWDRREYFFTFY